MPGCNGTGAQSLENIIIIYFRRRRPKWPRILGSSARKSRILGHLGCLSGRESRVSRVRKYRILGSLGRESLVSSTRKSRILGHLGSLCGQEYRPLTREEWILDHRNLTTLQISSSPKPRNRQRYQTTSFQPPQPHKLPDSAAQPISSLTKPGNFPASQSSQVSRPHDNFPLPHGLRCPASQTSQLSGLRSVPGNACTCEIRSIRFSCGSINSIL